MSDASDDGTQAPKEPYTSPALTSYGTIREITQNNASSMGRNDRTSGPTKTG